MIFKDRVNDDDLSSDTYLIVVNLHVLFKVGARGEALLAKLAQVGFLSRVDALVSDQVTNL